MKKVLIDPPEGWKYGFPKVAPPEYALWSEQELADWVVANGYPRSLVWEYGDHFHVRFMEADAAPAKETPKKKSSTFPSPEQEQIDMLEKTVNARNIEIQVLRDTISLMMRDILSR